MTVWQWANVHTSRTLKLKRLNGIQTLLMLLFRPVLVILRHVKMSSMKMTYYKYFCSTPSVQMCSNLVLIECRSTWVKLHSMHGTAGLHRSPITLACFVPLKKTTTKNSNPPPAEESMEFLTKLSESHLMVQQALMQSQYKLLYRSYSMWLYTHWLYEHYL